LKRRIRITIEFDGKPFTGWQRQARGVSVQGELESALAQILNHPITLYGAGRTDAGVHALGMVAHFDTDNPMPTERLPLALGGCIADTISVISAGEAAPDFDARRDALMRWYRYQIYATRKRHPLRPRAWYVFQPLDLKAMRKATELFEGKHDFSGFRSSTCQADRTKLTMREASLAENHGLIVIDFKCQSFLQRMVRLMVGSIVMAGLERISPHEISETLKTGIRRNNIRSAPPEGLCLMRIGYTAEEVQNILTDHPAAPSF